MLALSFAVIAAVAACTHSPLEPELERLEERVQQLEAERQQRRDQLQARLAAVPQTAANATEIAALRAKLSQGTAGAGELAELEARVAALEQALQDWSQLVARTQRTVYAVLHGVLLESGETAFTFVGTGFAVSPELVATNAHVVDALASLDAQVLAYNQRYGASLRMAWLLVQNQSTFLLSGYSLFGVGGSAVHPDWAPRDPRSVDVAVLAVDSGAIRHYAPLAARSRALRLRAGHRVCTLGFPGELQGGFLPDLFPIATFKDGTISALRPHDQGSPYSARDTYIVQHNLDLSGGTSGSPILDTEGQVIAINNAGIESVVMTIGGTPARVTQAALGFGIRADKLSELLGMGAPVAKRTLGAMTSQLVARLHGHPVARLSWQPEDWPRIVEQAGALQVLAARPPR